MILFFNSDSLILAETEIAAALIDDYVRGGHKRHKSGQAGTSCVLGTQSARGRRKTGRSAGRQVSGAGSRRQKKVCQVRGVQELRGRLESWLWDIPEIENAVREQEYFLRRHEDVIPLLSVGCIAEVSSMSPSLLAPNITDTAGKAPIMLPDVAGNCQGRCSFKLSNSTSVAAQRRNSSLDGLLTAVVNIRVS